MFCLLFFVVFYIYITLFDFSFPFFFFFFWGGVKILVSNIFVGFQKNEYFGDMKIFVHIYNCRF